MCSTSFTTIHCSTCCRRRRPSCGMLWVHCAEEWANLTLRDLWSFCREQGHQSEPGTVAAHSTGSLHPQDWNVRLHNYLTSGALSSECMRMPKPCNVCSTQMTPIPQPHTPGNMWAAHCRYIAKLIDPKDFREKMDDNKLGPHNNGQPWCVGRGRWADEHWVHSHPDVAPCDLDVSPSFVIGRGVPSSYQKQFSKAPLSYVDVPRGMERLSR